MAEQGWKRLLADGPWFSGEGSYPIAAYSEFMPPPRLGRKPYDGDPATLLDPADPWGWPVTEYEESLELQPGMVHVAEQLLGVLEHLGHCRPGHGIARNKLRVISAGRRSCRSGARRRKSATCCSCRWRSCAHRTTRAGCAGRFSAAATRAPAGPSCAASSPRQARTAGRLGRGFLPPAVGGRLSRRRRRPSQPPRAGLRIIPARIMPCCQLVAEEPLPSWTTAYRWQPGQSLRGVRYLLTFCPFGRLPTAVRRAYLAGGLNLLPFPGSLLFFAAPPYLKLQGELPQAVQIPLLHSLYRHERPGEFAFHSRAGCTSAARRAAAARGFRPLRNSFQRTHRWARVHRHQDELETIVPSEDKRACAV